MCIRDSIIVIYDDLSLPVGKLRIREKGSAGGHNGIKNIIYQLQTDVFPRIKIGIGAPQHSEYDIKDYVLGRFSTVSYTPLDVYKRQAYLNIDRNNAP